MNASIRIARIWDVPIRLHWSWFPIFALLTAALTAGFVPAEYPELSTGTRWLVGAVISLLLFGSVLLHELGHVRLAQRNGLPVREVTLYFFGGLALLLREPKTAGAELRIAIAGPLVSLALAAGFGALWLLDQAIPWLAAPSIRLARINLLLAVFNLLPGYPLDGGRVLRALLWMRTRDEGRATRGAASVGQVIAGGLIGIGVLRVLFDDAAAGIWLIAIGWFLQVAASAARAWVGLDETLRGVLVERVMEATPLVVSPGLSVQQLVDAWVTHGGGRAVLVAGERLPSGLVTVTDVTSLPRERWSGTSVQEVMVPLRDLVVVGPDTALTTALAAMDEAGMQQATVTERDRLVGLLTREQVLRYARTRAELGV